MLHFIDKEINTYLLTHGLQKNHLLINKYYKNDIIIQTRLKAWKWWHIHVSTVNVIFCSLNQLSFFHRGVGRCSKCKQKFALHSILVMDKIGFIFKECEIESYCSCNGYIKWIRFGDEAMQTIFAVRLDWRIKLKAVLF